MARLIDHLLHMKVGAKSLLQGRGAIVSAASMAWRPLCATRPGLYEERAHTGKARGGITGSALRMHMCFVGRKDFNELQPRVLSD